MPYASPELRRLRKAAGIKPGRFAKAVEVSPSHLCHVEAGRNKASDELFARAARHLGVAVEVLKAGAEDAA